MTTALGAPGRRSSSGPKRGLDVERGNDQAFDSEPIIATVRGTAVLTGFLALTLPLMPVQALLKRLAPGRARVFPHWYHRQVCRLIGMRLHVIGAVNRETPTLFVANHSTWLDIPVLSALAPVSFVAKKEVGTWPGVSWLAKLQRTVFVDRERRTEVRRSAGEIAARLAKGDSIVLFAEGTSTDGNRVLPFRSSLFAAAVPQASAKEVNPATATRDAVMQTVSIVYARRHGIALSRADRAHIGWYGDMEMVQHGWSILKSGPIDVVIHLGAPRPLEVGADRKRLASDSGRDVRETVLQLLRDPLPASQSHKPTNE